jgi:hypothetical protein
LPELAAEVEGGFSYNETKTYSGTLGGVFLSGFARAWIVPVTAGFTYRPKLPPAANSNFETSSTERFFQNLHPFIGAGAGAAFLRGEIEATAIPGGLFRDAGQDTQLTYYAKAGLTFDITDNVELGVQYRFSGISGFTIEATQSEDIFSHSITAALRISF